MLTFNLQPIFKARRIDRPYSFLVKAGISPTSATRILNSSTRVFRLKHIELICLALLCEPGDLLLWTPEEGQVYAPNNPLLNLHQTSAVNDLQSTLATIPFRQLNEVAETITRKSKE